MELYLEYTENSYGGDICEGQENDDYPDHEDERIDWKPTKLTTKKKQTYNVETIQVEKEFEKLYHESKLPWGPDESLIKDLLLKCLEHHYGSLEKCVERLDKYEIVYNQIKELIVSDNIKDRCPTLESRIYMWT